ncbi:MAG: ATPase [Treponema sp. GWB1_62_6]|nr:MAG: ATPase [Treponema sp. GWB1_62_6]OHE67690.1 MAG: ATPase [Treponema sp. GWC1_61_84]OHE76857.1 MAG: ATPase [Treponema sp. RIFOXYC1_FULL_61_9]HCM29059.1 ATPase [Treponema sp.]
MKRKMLLIVPALLCAAAALSFAQTGTAEGAGAAVAAAGAVAQSPWKYFAAALSVGISCIAGGIAVGQIGAAAMGAMSENPELAGKALPYAGLAEGICLWGFLVALFILLI